jgi:hypothetical protein
MNVEPQTPGQTEPTGTTEAPPQNAGTTTAPPSTTQATPPQKEAETGTPDGQTAPAAPAAAPGRDDKGRFLSNEERAKAGEAGGWMQVLSPQDRDELKSEPWRYAEMKAKVAAYEAAQAAYRTPEPPKAAPDAAEVYANRMARLHSNSEKMTVEDFYREQAVIQRDYQSQIASEIASKQAEATYAKMSEKQEIQWIASQAESKDADFMDKVVGLWTRANGSLTRAQAFEQTRSWFAGMSKANVAPVPRVPTPAPHLGELRSVSQPSIQPSEDIYQRFARTAGGKAINGRQNGR